MHFQWYPGHMTKAKRAMQEDIKLIDVIVELVDARIPRSSKNPDIDALANGKSRILLLNKSDMADPAQTARWKAYYEKQGFFVLAVNSTKRSELKAVNQLIQKACKEKIERDRKRGILNRPIRAMIVGIPNVGKSTFINSFAGKACTKTGNKPGVTKGKQWIGSIKDEILQRVEIALDLIEYLKEAYPGTLASQYGIEESNDSAAMLEEIGNIRKCIKKGTEIDYEKTAALILDDFRSSKLGLISLETPSEAEK